MIRLAIAADAPTLAEIYAPYVLETAISFEETPPDAAEMRSRLTAGMKTYPWLVAQRDGVVEGFCYGSVHRTRPAYRWSVEVTVYVRRGLHRRGVGAALYARLLELLARQGYRSAFAGITLPNAGSVALHERIGFRHLGVFEAVGFKLGAWHDVGWWRRDLGDRGTEPRDPIRLEELEA